MSMAAPDHTFLQDWFTRLRSPLRRFLVTRGVHRVADLDDVSQEVFLRLLRYDKAEVVEHPQAYLFKVATNVAAEWAMRARHRFQHDSEWLNTLVVDDRQDELFDSEVVQREIKRSLDTLSERARAILKLHFEEGATHEQIARRLGLSLRIVRRDFEKSYARLRNEVRLDVTGALHRDY
jgi:RNA polymerase sigma-70 factor (ECF subfamily)